MTEPVWGQLDKAQDDDETIEEAIDRLILAHDDDSDSHVGTGKSLNTHKQQTTIDHPAGSVVEDKIGDEEISNPKQKTKVRAYTAIVDVNGDYDYTNIQDAIDYVNGLGGGQILIKGGTYTQDSDITLYSNIELVGEYGKTEIDFNETTYQMLIEGTEATGKYDIILRNLYIMGGRKEYEGTVRCVFTDYITVDHCIFYDNSASPYNQTDLQFQDCNYIDVVRSSFQDGATSILLGDADDVNIEKNKFYNNYNHVIQVFDGCDNIRIYKNLVISGDQQAIHVDGSGGPAPNLHILSNFLQSSSAAIYFSYVNNSIISGNSVDDGGISLNESVRNIIKGNRVESDGINLTQSSNYNVIKGNICDNADYGIDIDSANCDKNIVVGNHLLDNTTGGLRDSGTDTEVAHNITS